MLDIVDLIIVGSGPVGLAAALEAKKLNLNTIVLDKGLLCNSLFNFPSFMRFFTTADLLEIGGHPFPSTSVKPSRQQALDYYRRVVQNNNLNILLHHEVIDIIKENMIFLVSGKSTNKGENKGFTLKSRAVIVATGYFDNPVGLGGIPGENGFNTSYYYSEPHRFYDKDVVIIGAGNSGAETALELYRHGARVTIIHNNDSPKSSLKYWVGPDLLNRISNKEINAVMPANTKEIDLSGVYVEYEGKDIHIPADFILILTGFIPNIKLLEKWSVEYNKDTLKCMLTDKFESNIKNFYLIGSVGFGRATNSVFIENGREHAKIAVKHIKSKLD